MKFKKFNLDFEIKFGKDYIIPFIIFINLKKQKEAKLIGIDYAFCINFLGLFFEVVKPNV